MTHTNADSPRMVVIGVGANIFKNHRRAQTTEDANVIAVCDLRPEIGKQRAAEIGCAFYDDYHTMLAELKPDAAVVITPHPSHPRITIDCLRAGCHVLVEKPMAADVSAADAMIAAAEENGRILAVNFQHRFRPAVEKAHQLVLSGEIGPIVRTLCLEPWYRTEYYYTTEPWRAKWVGEGGGVLLNQAPHTLDTLCYLAGMPRKVWGWVRTLYHAVDSEDSAQAMFEYPNGAPGYLTASTVEHGVQPRLQVVGEKGALELVGNTISIFRNNPSTREYMFSSQEMFGHPDTTSETLDLPDTSGGHDAVYRDFIAAIKEGRQPRCDGRGGLMSLELANAMMLSSYEDRPVRLPLDRAAFSALLQDLQAGRRPINPDTDKDEKKVLN